MIPQWYQELSRRAREAFTAGELEQADALLLQAESRAQQTGHEELSYEAFCRRCDVLIALDRISETNEVLRLKKILLKATEPRTRWMAAYYTAVAYDIFGKRDKAYPYAERSIAIADETGNIYDMASSANLLGTLALVASRFDEAEEAYRRALELYEAADSFQELMEAQLRDNLGYVLICTERLDRGINLCEQARMTMDRLGADHYLHQPLQDLCYGYLLADQLAPAHRCGEQGLALALQNNDNLVAKNLYYLLAEVAVRSGDRFRAGRYLNELSRFYPEIPCSEEIVDLLMGMDFTQVVNLRG